MHKHTIQLFWQYIWRHRPYAVAIILITPLTFLFHQFLPPLIIAGLLNQLVKGDFIATGFATSFGGTLLLYTVVFIFGNVILWRLLGYLMWKLELLVTKELAQDVFHHVMGLDVSFHDTHLAGSLVSQATKLLGAYTRLVDTTILIIGSLVMSLVFTSVILLPRAPQFVGILYILAIIYVAVAVFYAKKVRNLNTQEAQAQSHQTGILADSIGNALAVKGFAAEDYEDRRYSEASEHTYRAGSRLMRITTQRNSYFSVVGSAFSISSVSMAIVSVVYFRADVGTAFLVLTYGLNVVQKLWDFSTNALRDYNRAFGDAHDMVAILRQAPDVADPIVPTPANFSAGQVEFRHVGFKHKEASTALFSNFNLSIKAGEKVGLVGHSGAGKTTFTKLLLRFVDVDAGQILIDGQNITELAQADLRRHIAYVPQEPLLFHRSVRENIAYGKPDATQEEIRTAAIKAHALEFIDTLPQGFETLVGERGVKLSGGQRQRIAIARAILKNAPILVLDEATSALDSVSEKAVQAALLELIHNRTTIAIAHRLSTIQHLDRIVVMEDGKIVEDGSHQQLLAKRGVYAQLWKHQSGGFIKS